MTDLVLPSDVAAGAPPDAAIDSYSDDDRRVITIKVRLPDSLRFVSITLRARRDTVGFDNGEWADPRVDLADVVRRGDISGDADHDLTRDDAEVFHEAIDRLFEAYNEKYLDFSPHVGARSGCEQCKTDGYHGSNVGAVNVARRHQLGLATPLRAGTLGSP